MGLFATLLLLHVLAATLWVGGMIVFTVAVRPAAMALEPRQRIRFMGIALERFFAWVTAAIVVLWVSGLTLLAFFGGFAAAPWTVHAMASIAALMTLVFAWLRAVPYRRLQRALAGPDTTAAAGALAAVRAAVRLNLTLGLLVYAVAILGPVL